MKIVVTGVNGILGREFAGVGKKQGHWMIGWTRENLNLEAPETGLQALQEMKPDLVVHCAAQTNVDECELHPDQAILVNEVAAGKLAYVARQVGAMFIFISTGGVFDGGKQEPYIEEDMPIPKTAYARSKYAGEIAVARAYPRALILRAGWLFGGSMEMKKNFVGARLKEAVGKDVLYSAIDKIGTPTWTRDFALRALALVQEPVHGVIHLANAGSVSRFEYVKEIVTLKGLTLRVEGVDSSNFKRAANVPANESLSSVRIRPLRSWKEALTEYLLDEVGELRG